LWLRYDLISDNQVLDEYNKTITGFMIQGESPTFSAASEELQSGLNGLLEEASRILKVSERMVSLLPEHLRALH